MKEKGLNIIKRPLILIIASAFFSFLPFTFSSLSFLLYFSFAPFLYVMIKKNSGKLSASFLKGFLFGFLYYVGIYYWFLWMHPLDYAGLSGVTSICVVCLAWLGISLIHGALWCVPTILCRLVNKWVKSPALLGFVGIFGILVAQKVTSYSQLAFPWVRIALPQYRATALIQMASLFGMDGLDMFILTINLLIVLMFIYPPNKIRLCAACAALLFALNLAFGLCRLNITDNNKELKIVTVQGNVDAEAKWSNESDSVDSCYQIYNSLTAKNLTSDVDLVIWPESAVPVNLENYPVYVDLYKEFSCEIKTPILMGALWMKDDKYANTTTLIDGNNVLKPYIKRKTAPFGEFMPYRPVLSKLFPALSKINVLQSDYVNGTETVIMKTDMGNIGNVICLEITHPQLSRQSVSDGAEFMVAVTNDSWLKDSSGTWQHAAHTVFRSIENSRYFVRSANSGVTLVTDTRGRIVSSLGALKQGALTQTIYLCDETTV